MKKCLFLLVTFLLFSCAPKNLVILPDYEKDSIKDFTLLVVLTDEPFIENTGDVTDDLGEGVPEDVYVKYFNKTFPKYLYKYTHSTHVEIDTSNNFLNLTEEILDFRDKEKIKLNVPQNLKDYKLNKFKPQFILFIQDLKIYRKEGTQGTFTVEGPSEFTPGAPGKAGVPRMTSQYSGGSSPELDHSGKFLIWDNINNRKVSYGQIRSITKFAFGMRKSTWNNALENMVLSIFRNSPFQVRTFDEL